MTPEVVVKEEDDNSEPIDDRGQEQASTTPRSSPNRVDGDHRGRA